MIRGRRRHQPSHPPHPPHSHFDYSLYSLPDIYVCWNIFRIVPSCKIPFDRTKHSHITGMKATDAYMRLQNEPKIVSQTENYSIHIYVFVINWCLLIAVHEVEVATAAAAVTVDDRMHIENMRTIVIRAHVCNRTRKINGKTYTKQKSA